MAVGGFSGILDLKGETLTAVGVQPEIFVAAFDTSSGKVIWARQFGSGNIDVATAVAVGPSGAVFVAGTMRGQIDFGTGPITPFGDTDGFVVRLGGEQGTAQSVKHFGGAGGPIVVPSSIAVDPDGKVIVAGSFSGAQVNFGPKKLHALGGMDIFLAKLDTDLDTIYVTPFGETNKSQHPGPQVAVGMTGNIVLAGSYVGNVDFGHGPLDYDSGFDVFVAKFNPDLGAGWSRRFGSDQDAILTGVDVDSEGNIVLVGNFVGTLDFGGLPLTSQVENDVFVAKLAP